MSLSAPHSGVTLMIVDIARLLRRRFEAALDEVNTGLTVAEARTLAIVWRNPGLRQAALAERMNVEPMTLVGYLDALEAEDLIQRSVDPKDRRANLITLTSQADPVLEKIEIASNIVRARAMTNVPAARREELEGLLAAMHDSLSACEPESPGL